MQDKYIT
jgi:arsenite-transporting ATPase